MLRHVCIVAHLVSSLLTIRVLYCIWIIHIDSPKFCWFCFNFLVYLYIAIFFWSVAFYSNSDRELKWILIRVYPLGTYFAGEIREVGYLMVHYARWCQNIISLWSQPITYSRILLFQQPYRGPAQGKRKQTPTQRWAIEHR